MCKMESLKDGVLDLYDLVLANESLDVEEENQYRMNEYLKHGND